MMSPRIGNLSCVCWSTNVVLVDKAAASSTASLSSHVICSHKMFSENQFQIYSHESHNGDDGKRATATAMAICEQPVLWTGAIRRKFVDIQPKTAFGKCWHAFLCVMPSCGDDASQPSSSRTPITPHTLCTHLHTDAAHVITMRAISRIEFNVNMSVCFVVLSRTEVIVALRGSSHIYSTQATKLQTRW